MSNEEQILAIIEGIKTSQESMRADIERIKTGQESMRADIEEVKTDIAIIKVTQNHHTFLLKKVANYVEKQTDATVSLEKRVTELERLAGII